MTPSVALNGAHTYTKGVMSNATGAHEPAWQDVSVQADYVLSKRTDVYVQATYQHVASGGSGFGRRCQRAIAIDEKRASGGRGGIAAPVLMR